MIVKGMSGAEALLRVLRAMGVERIFASPGSDWAPLWEALAKGRLALLHVVLAPVNPQDFA